MVWTQPPTHRIFDGPVGVSGGITQVLEVVDVAEELIVKLRIGDNWHGTVLQSGTGVHTSCTYVCVH